MEQRLQRFSESYKAPRNFWILFFLLSIFTFNQIQEAQAQQRKWRGFWEGFGKSKEEFDDSLPFYVGMTFPQYSNSRYIIEKAQNWNTINVSMPSGGTDNFTSIHSKVGHEVGVGIPVRWRINDFFSISTGVTYMVLRGEYEAAGPENGVRLEYRYTDKDITHIRMQKGTNAVAENFRTIEFPIHLKIYSNHKFLLQNSRYPYRLYLLGGTSFNRHYNANKYYSELSRLQRVDPPLIFKHNYWNLEGGIGLDIYTPYTKLSIESRFTQSIGSILDHSRHDRIQNEFVRAGQDHPNHFMDAISQLGVRGWQISIIFE